MSEVEKRHKIDQFQTKMAAKSPKIAKIKNPKKKKKLLSVLGQVACCVTFVKIHARTSEIQTRTYGQTDGRTTGRTTTHSNRLTDHRSR